MTASAWLVAPRVQLKNIVTAPRLSKNSTAFSAGLWVDGKFWGVLSDRGQGGPFIFDPAQNRPHEHLGLLAERIANQADARNVSSASARRRGQCPLSVMIPISAANPSRT